MKLVLCAYTVNLMELLSRIPVEAVIAVVGWLMLVAWLASRDNPAW